MAKQLKAFGWSLFTVDIQWYEPKSKGFDYRKDAVLTMDRYGRLMPAPEKFPSAAGGKGFRPLADAIHRKGLEFGIHMMRGIPRQAVAANLPILGTPYHAADVADTSSTCSWNPDMYGVDMAKPGAQAYYDSVFRQAADWGIDFVKVDDLSRPYHQAEIEAIRKAIDRTGRKIVFSTSPGETPLASGPHVQNHAKHVADQRRFLGQLALPSRAVSSGCMIGRLTARRGPTPTRTCFRWAWWASAARLASRPTNSGR